MKRSRIFVTILLILFLMPVASAQGMLRWLNANHNFGTFSEDLGKVTCVYMAVNDGDSAVVVLDARANCGCTRPEYDRKPIAPGDTLKMAVTYDADGRPGRFNKQVKVTTNAINATTVLILRGTVVGNSNTLQSRYPIEVKSARLSNDITAFGTTRKGRVLASAVNIYNTSGDTLRPMVKDMPAVLNATFSPQVIPPGEQGTLSLTAYTDRTDAWGTVEDSLYLVVDSRCPDEVKKISTVMVIMEDFSKLTDKELADAPKISVSSQLVDFDRFQEDGSVAARLLTIANKGKSPMIIRQMCVADKAVTLEGVPQKIKPGKSAEIRLVVDRTKLLPDGVLNAKINLMVNDPEHPMTTIRITGIDDGRQ